MICNKMICCNESQLSHVISALSILSLGVKLDVFIKATVHNIFQIFSTANMLQNLS